MGDLGSGEGSQGSHSGLQPEGMGPLYSYKSPFSHLLGMEALRFGGKLPPIALVPGQGGSLAVARVAILTIFPPVARM